jgi:hypothetical protein
MTTTSRRAVKTLCALVMGAGLALGTATGAMASPVAGVAAATVPAPAPSPVWEQDPTPLVIQTSDYPVTMTVTSGPKAGYQQQIAPRSHEVFPTTPNFASSVTFTFEGVEQGQTYEIRPDQVMRFDMLGSAQYPQVALRTS